MMNRKLAMALAVSMVVGSLAACGGKTDQAGTTAASKAENAQGGQSVLRSFISPFGPLFFLLT